MQSPRAPRRVRRNERHILLFIVFAVLLAGLIIISPKEPTRKALNVNAEGQVVQQYDGLVISEVMSANGSALPDETGQFTDWLEVWNSSDHDIDLKDISLSNRSDKAKFIFPAHVLPPDGRVIVFASDTNQNDPGRAYHAKFKISSIAANLFMFNPAGHVMYSLTVPTLNTNEVYELAPDGTYQKSTTYSPGFPNSPEGHQQYLAAYAVTPDQLLINEIMATPRSGLRDEDGDLSDWIELYNSGTTPFDLSNLALSDNPDRPLKWLFPEGAVVKPGSYYVVFASGKNKLGAGGFPHTNFSLSGEGETIILSTRQGQLLDRVQYANMPLDQSYGRDPNTGNWQVFPTGTPGAANDAAGAAMADRYMRGLNTSGVFLSELMSSNDVVAPMQGAEPSDWVELYNSSDQIQDLSRWGLSDSISWPRKWQFPQGTVIYPGEYKVVLLNKSRTGSGDVNRLAANYALARAGGEVMTLSDPEGNVLDRIILPEIPANIAYGRAAEKDGFFYFETPTPGAANSQGFTGFAQRPQLSLKGGLYKENIQVTITSTAGTRVRYTLDGSIPTIDKGTDYTGPIEIKDTAVLRARSFVPGLQPSETETATYVMKTYYTLPVISLVMDPDQLWNPETGVYATGNHPDGTPIDLRAYAHIPFKNPTPTYRLHGKEARPAYAEMFDSATGEVIFSQGVRAGLLGQFSLDMPQKSFKVMAKAAFGSRYFEAKLFEDRPYEQYKSFVLRNSGNDQVWTRMVDGVQSRLMDQLGTPVIHQAWRPVIVYLNGQYWGHYNLRERVSRYFVAQHEGIPLEKADDMTILEAGSSNYWGSNKEYLAMRDRIRKSSPATNPEDLQYILDEVDVDNLFDFLAIQMFFANTDSGNVRFYRVPGGKWRWILFDFDYGLFNSASNGVLNMMNPKGHGSGDDVDNSLWLKILENDQMRDKFLRRFGEIFQFFTIQRMLDQVQASYDILAPEMPMHFERWAAQNLKNVSADQPQTVDGTLRYWNSRVDRLRNVIMKRPRHCWVQVQDWFKLSDQQMNDYFGPKPAFPPEAELNANDTKIQ